MAHQRMAVVDAGSKVTNVIIYDTEGSWLPPDGCTLVDASEAGGVGDTWDGSRFLPEGYSEKKPKSIWGKKRAKKP